MKIKIGDEVDKRTTILQSFAKEFVMQFASLSVQCAFFVVFVVCAIAMLFACNWTAALVATAGAVTEVFFIRKFVRQLAWLLFIAIGGTATIEKNAKPKKAKSN